MKNWYMKIINNFQNLHSKPTWFDAIAKPKSMCVWVQA